MNLKMSPDSPYDSMDFFVCTFRRTSPVSTLTARRLTVTWSCLYCLENPIPRVLAPLPPVSILESYPIIPPSIIIPAKSIGPTVGASSPKAFAASSLPDLIICLSLTKWSIPCLSTTLNHEFPPAVFKASISISNPP